MNDTPFSPETRRALDTFAVPPQVPGFAGRALAKVRARGDAPAPPLPRLARRWRSASPWRRSGWIVASVAGLSLMSATAAATGAFGEPLEVPVLSPIARSLEIVPAPAASLAQAASLAPADPRVVPAPAAATSHDAPRERIDALLDDPEFRALPAVERRAELRRTARALVNSGEARPREVVAALRETARERVAQLPPEQRQQITQAVIERRETRREILTAPPAERRQLRRQAIRERLADLRERRAQRLEQEAAGDAVPEPAEPVADSEPVGEGSGVPVR